MNKLIEFYDEISSRRESNNIRLYVDHTPITDWTIQIRIGIAGDYIFNEQDGDIDLLSARAQVKLKKWLIEHIGGY